jgi:hypothetical protein
MANGLTFVGAEPADEIFRPAGASDRASPSAIWLVAELATQRKRMWRGRSVFNSPASVSQVRAVVTRAFGQAVAPGSTSSEARATRSRGR